MVPARRMYVLMLPGWDTSEGVKREIALAERFQLPIEYWVEENGFRRQD